MSEVNTYFFPFYSHSQLSVLDTVDRHIHIYTYVLHPITVDINYLCFCVYYRLQRLLCANVNGSLSFCTASLHLNKMTYNITCHQKITTTVEVSKEKEKVCVCEKRKFHIGY